MKASMAISGNAAIIAFKEKVVVRNVRMENYEKRRITFQKETDAFDAALKKL
jgi:hypothetical protein